MESIPESSRPTREQEITAKSSQERSCQAPRPEGQLLIDYVRKHELAEEFEVSERTIERWVRMRLLPTPVKLGRSTLFHLPTVRAHLAKQVKSKSLSHARKRI